jgi:hypothetical protein
MMIRILSALALGATMTLAMAEPVTLTDAGLSPSTSKVSLAMPEPVTLTGAQMDQVVAGSEANFPPGQFPSGNPAHAPGNSNPNEHPK